MVVYCYLHSFKLPWLCSEIKERIKKTKDEKKAKKAEVAKSQKLQNKGAVQKGSKGPKLGGGGGKRWRAQKGVCPTTVLAPTLASTIEP